ncbi:MAG: class I SAM-dependent methyltransferase [Bacteroidota bacterium]
MKKIELYEKERATTYDDLIETWISGYSYFLDSLPQVLSGTKNKNLLSVGCGTGNSIQRLVKATEGWQITGIDPSPDMIKEARAKLGDKENVRLVEGLVGDFKIKEKYGAATLLLVLHFLEDDGTKLQLLKDIADRLRTGATFVMLDITGTKSQIQQNLKVLKRLLPSQLGEAQREDRIHKIQQKLYAVSEERLAELCEEAGFEKPLRFFQSSIYKGWMTKKIR